MDDQTSGLCHCGCGWSGAQLDRSTAVPAEQAERPSAPVQAAAEDTGRRRGRRWRVPALALPVRARRR